MNQEYFKSDDHYEIKTGKILENDSRGYFQLLFDKFKFVIEITCVTRGALNIGNTIALYGKHAGIGHFCQLLMSVLNECSFQSFYQPNNFSLTASYKFSQSILDNYIHTFYICHEIITK